MHSLVVVITVGLLAGCGHTNGFYNDRTMPMPIDEQSPCMSCGGTGNALEIGAGAAALVLAIVVAKLR